MSEADAPDPDAALVEALQNENAPPEDENPDEAEIELGAEKLKVPRKVKEAWDGIQSTTQKDRESLRAEREAVAKDKASTAEYTRLTQSFGDDMASIKSIDKQLEPYMKLTPSDWVAWGSQDQDAALKAQTQINALQMERQKLAQGMQSKYNDMTAKQQAAETERRANAERDLSVKIKDWTPAKRAEITKAAEAYGFSASEVEPFTYDARAVSILQDALTLRALRAKAAVPKNLSAEQSPPPETTTTKVRSNTGAVDPYSDRKSVDTFRDNFLKERRARMTRG